jgi:SAM-dependent methyltransferase
VDPEKNGQSLALDLGCGANPKNPFGADILYGIDIREDISKNVIKADLVLDPIPFEENTFDYVTAFDFIEHIPRIIYAPSRRNSFIEVMNEIWRVLKQNGKFLSVTPAYPHAEVFRDPTHVNIITEETFPLYFDAERRWGAMYGFRGAFEIEGQSWNGPHLQTLMRKI